MNERGKCRFHIHFEWFKYETVGWKYLFFLNKKNH
jgi:hypothetical protein